MLWVEAAILPIISLASGVRAAALVGRSNQIAAVLEGQATTNYLLAFGSSTTQTGFDIYGPGPSEANPIGNPALPGLTTSGGYNWIGFLTTTLNTSITLTYNQAVGGATTDSSLVPSPWDFVDELDEVETWLKSNTAPWNPSNLLVAVWIANNDVGRSYDWSNTTSVYASVSQKYFDQLQTLVGLGAKNFVILTCAPQHRTPLFLSQSDSVREKLSAAVDKYNDLMRTNLATFKAKNPGVSAWLVEAGAAYNKALDNPTAYGAPNNYCYAEDGLSCLWYNDYHPAIVIHRLLAQEVAHTVGAPWF